MNEPTHAVSAADDEDEISLLDLLQTVVENLRLLIFAPLAAGLLALGISFLIPPTFTATTQFMPPQQQQSSAAALLQSLGSLGGLAGAATGIKNPNDQFVSFLQSRSIQDRLIERFKLLDRYEAEFMQDARLALSGSARISSGKDGLITVSVDDKDPAFAAELANAHVAELSDLLGRLAVTEAQQRRVFFEKQLANAQGNLVKAEQALQATGINASVLRADPTAAVAGLAQLQASITAQEVKVASMRGYLAESAPEFRQALTELAALRTQLRRAEQSQTPASPGDSDYIAKFRDFKYNETLFELFAKQYELARVDESREGAVIQVVDVAIAPDRKSKPKKALIAVLTTLATGFALLLFVFVRQAVRNAAQDAESAAKLSQLRQAWARALGRRSNTLH
jgi:uncharacterized protein involved in exopolysaccharide biosynthesis